MQPEARGSRRGPASRRTCSSSRRWDVLAMDVLASAVSAAFDALPQIRRDEIAQLLNATDAAIKGTANNSSTLAAVKRTLLEELGLTVAS